MLPPQSKHQVTPWSPWLPQMRVVTSQIQGWTSMRLKSPFGKSSTFFRLKLVVGGTIFHRSDEECREIFSPMLRSLSLASQQGVVDRLVEFVWSEDVVGFDGCLFFHYWYLVKVGSLVGFEEWALFECLQSRSFGLFSLWWIFQTPEIVSPDEYRGFWITGEVNADGFMEIKVTGFV